MSENSRLNRQSDALKEEAQGRAALRAHRTVAATAGAETVPAFKDSLGADVVDASPLDFDQRDKGKKGLLAE